MASQRRDAIAGYPVYLQKFMTSQCRDAIAGYPVYLQL